MSQNLNPGSQEAIKLDCTCPVMDNHDGEGIPITGDRVTVITAFYIVKTCPIHAAQFLGTK